MCKSSKSKGFTLIELLIAMAISGIVAGAIFTAFKSQQKSYLIQDQVAEMQQNLRASMDIMARDIRMAGYSQGAPGFGITDILPRDKDNNVDGTITGNGAFEFTADFDNNGTLDGGETISYSVYDSPVLDPDGNPDLARGISGVRQLLTENIHALGFAYAFDADGNGILDTSPNGNIIWANDTNANGDWDRLDLDDDGYITAADGPGVGNNGIINGFDTGIPVNTNQIRAVKIWLLARSDTQDTNYIDTNTYVVGRRVITPNDNFRRRLLTSTVRCRNMGL
jgi:type IV pilus assembly protein PilW